MSDKIRVGFDPHGADSDGTDSPLVRQVAALAKVSCEFSDSVQFVCTGDRDAINSELDKHPHAGNIEIEPVKGVFAMDGKVDDYRNTPTTISRLAEMHATGEIDALCSNGNTTATVYYPALKSGMLARGIRPCLVTQMPRNFKSFYYLADAGANKQARAQHLAYNAVLTQLYLQFVKGIVSPRIGLLQGPLADEAKQFFGKVENFVGIVSPRDVYRDTLDVIVSDGFNGNIYLKDVEATAQATMIRLKSSTTGQKLWASVARLFGMNSILMPYFAPHTKRYESLRALGERTYSLHPIENIEQIIQAAPYMAAGYNGRQLGVLSNGEEDVKGNRFAQDLAKKLKEAPVKYVGFVEPDDILHGVAHRNGSAVRIDSVFTQSQTADLFLDTIEATEKAVLGMVSPLFRFFQFIFNKEGVREQFIELKEGVMNPNHYNFAPVLGIDGYAGVGHGKATKYGTEQMLRATIAYRQSKFIEHYVKERIQKFAA